MKILCLIMCFLIFSSCSQGDDAFLTLPFEEKVKFTDGELTVEGDLFFDGEKMVFSPHTPKGYVITVTKSDSRIEYDGIVFKKNILPLSRFLPLYNMLCELNKDNSGVKIGKNPISVEKGNLKITVLEE